MGVNQNVITYNLFSYCGNNPIIRSDFGGTFWNTVIGAISGAIVGGVTAALTGTDVKAGIVSGAISGGAAGLALDVAIATGGTGLVAFAAVVTFSGLGGATGSYVNQRMNGISKEDIDWEEVIIDGTVSAIGSVFSFGLADIGGPGCQTLKQIFSQSGKTIGRQFLFDFSTTTIIGGFSWVHSSYYKYYNERAGEPNYARSNPYGEERTWTPRGA